MVSRDLVNHHVSNRRGDHGSFPSAGRNLGKHHSLGPELSDINSRPISKHVAHAVAIMSNLHDARDFGHTRRQDGPEESRNYQYRDKNRQPEPTRLPGPSLSGTRNAHFP